MNLVEINHIRITLFRSIWHQMEFRLGPNQSGKCYCDPNFVQINQDSEKMSPSVSGYILHGGRTIRPGTIHQQTIRPKKILENLN